MAKRQKEAPNADLALERLKKLAIIAMFSDDQLMQLLVLKGGNALDIVHHISTRASIDVDLSMEQEFPRRDLGAIHAKIEKSLKSTFRLHRFEAFDVTFVEKPRTVTPDLADFWGGYRIEFKVIGAEDFARHSADLQALRRNAIQIGPRGKFQIEISKFECCSQKQPQDLDGYRIFVYTPAMIACEKLRAICQQSPEYSQVVKRNRPGAARARDFVDIHAVVEHFGVDMASPESEALLQQVFAAKRVPLQWLGRLPEQREFHRPDFAVVQDAVKPGVRLKDFDFYFDFVVDLCRGLKPLRNV